MQCANRGSFHIFQSEIIRGFEINVSAMVQHEVNFRIAETNFVFVTKFNEQKDVFLWFTIYATQIYDISEKRN